ncbi:aminopeptidase P family protein [Cytobacillus oceanisediminis]|uniref:M24 family metallopeptidase n=1 Tax=Cytobacillus oceanisediminis TaxID=665099 RepID=UPI001D144B21|nr:Xaa-Pro peptidase family protein [Cytobacillus oceanisediminis]MCC3648518.1 aminopeptidase P family protein [Cytobacillus oceanisediminis]
MRLSISRKEIKTRQERFWENLQQQELDCAIIFSPIDIFYLTGFFFHPTERPIAFFMDSDQKTHLFVPFLEKEHAEEFSGAINLVHSYPEYPGIKHPMEYFKEDLIAAGFQGKRVGADSLGYASASGYRGPSVDQLLEAKEYQSIKDMVPALRMIKSGEEIELIKESCRWGNLAHRLLQKYSKSGLSELEITSRASTESTLAMIETLGPEYKPHGETAFALFRGQVGEMSAYPHAVAQNVTLKKGDTLVTAAAASIWGYKSELERTMFVEEVSSEQEEYFQHMYNAQEVAFQHIKPGKALSTVEEEVQRYFKENNITHLTRHHTGHAIGLLFHESPFFDLGDHTIMKPGMVFTVEPGIYVKGVGGFRHSDTVLVTEDSMEMLTYYPRDLGSLICN